MSRWPDQEKILLNDWFQNKIIQVILLKYCVFEFINISFIKLISLFELIENI